MFSVPTLQQLAAQKTVDNFLNLGWKIPYPIDTVSTNAIINVFPKDSRTTFIRQNYQNLEIGKMDFSDEINVKEDIRMLCSFVLDSLILGDISLEGFYGSPVHIVVLLKDVLQDKSRQRLCHLNVGNGAQFTPNWLEKVLDLVPNLKSLAIQNEKSTYLPDFFKLSKQFELVRILDLSYITIASLEGISNFPNLEILILYNTEIGESESVKEISKLKKLIELDVSRNPDWPVTRIVKNLLNFCDSLPELRFIDCCTTNINNAEIRKILGIAPKLEKIALHMNRNYDRTLLRDDPRLVDSFDLQSTIQLCRYFESKNRTKHMIACFNKMRELIEFEFSEHGDCPILHEFLHFIFELFDSSMGNEEGPTLCILCYCENFKQFLDNQEKLKIASTLIKAILRNIKGARSNEMKTTCWNVIRDWDIISIPGAPDIRRALLTSIFEHHLLTGANIGLLRRLVETEELSQVFKNDRNHAFWITKSVRLLNSIKPRRNAWTRNALDYYKLFIDMCNHSLEQCSSEIDIEDVIVLIGHLKVLDGYEELLHSVTKAIRSMILLVDHRYLYRIDRNLIIELFKNIHGDLLRYNEHFRSYLENERARFSVDIVKFVLFNMSVEHFNCFSSRLYSELFDFIRTKRSREYRIPIMDDNGLCPTKNVLISVDWASEVIKEVLKQVQRFEVPKNINDGQTRNPNGELLEKNVWKDRRVNDVLRSYSIF